MGSLDWPLMQSDCFIFYQTTNKKQILNPPKRSPDIVSYLFSFITKYLKSYLYLFTFNFLHYKTMPYYLNMYFKKQARSSLFYILMCFKFSPLLREMIDSILWTKIWTVNCSGEKDWKLCEVFISDMAFFPM